MRILFLTKSKEYTLKFLEQMHQEGNDVLVICKDYSSFKSTEMEKYCLTHNITYLDNHDLYEELRQGRLSKFDLAISNTYGRLIKKELIEWLKGKIINLHCAVLPDYKGMFTYNWGIYNLENEWGVTAHFVNEEFDAGDILSVVRFSIDPTTISVSELESRSQQVAYAMSMDIVRKVDAGKPLTAIPQENRGRYYSREDFERLKRIDVDDNPGIIQRKILACWCPPYEGAYIEIKGQRYCIITEDVVRKIADE